MSGWLKKILATKRAEVDALEDRGPRERPTRAACDVAAALKQADALSVIAEIKFRSPSAGALSSAMTAADRAIAYAEGGASMVSVLCDPMFFGGSYDDIKRSRAALDARGFARVPILAKEFVLDPLQLDEARAVGADAALLIVRILEEGQLESLVKACRERGLEAFVEVATEDELKRAVDADAKIIGVNARDLDTLEMDAERAAKIISSIPKDRIAVHLSGTSTPDDVKRAAKTRADALLIGEALMREDDPKSLLKRMLAQAAK